MSVYLLALHNIIAIQAWTLEEIHAWAEKKLALTDNPKAWIAELCGCSTHSEARNIVSNAIDWSSISPLRTSQGVYYAGYHYHRLQTGKTDYSTFSLRMLEEHDAPVYRDLDPAYTTGVLNTRSTADLSTETQRAFEYAQSCYRLALHQIESIDVSEVHDLDAESALYDNKFMFFTTNGNERLHRLRWLLNRPKTELWEEYLNALLMQWSSKSDWEIGKTYALEHLKDYLRSSGDWKKDWRKREIRVRLGLPEIPEYAWLAYKKHFQSNLE